MRNELRQIVAEHGKLSVPVATLDDDADLFAAGLDSLAVVNVMLAIEEQFGIEIPDEMLNRRAFSSIAEMARALEFVAA